MSTIKKKLFKKEKQSARPNIVPVLDAVFIFIFFLLMSAEFIKFYVIHSDSPAVKMVHSIGHNKKTPLNLALEIKENRIIVKTNPEGQVRNILYKKDGQYDWSELKKIVEVLKRKNIEENSIILRPYDELPYEVVIKIIDIVRLLPPGTPPIISKDSKGKTVQSKKLFDRVIFEKKT